MPRARTFWLRPATATALLLATLCGGGCSSEKVPHAGSPPEPSFAEQVAAVRAGRSQQIRLDEQEVGDEHLALLAGLEARLLRINLSHTSITDKGLARIAEMQNLEQLRLASDALTDAGLAELAELKNLRHLHLIGAPQGDAGLAHLEKMTWLRSLYLDGGKFSDEALGQLVTALPGVHLHFDGGHHPGDAAADDHGHEH